MTHPLGQNSTLTSEDTPKEAAAGDETSKPESTPPDATGVETSAPESTPLDATGVETSAPESTPPDATGVETSAPESTPPHVDGGETSAPESTPPHVDGGETSAPESAPPNAAGGETSAPESAPHVDGGETSAPESAPPDATGGETSAPESAPFNAAGVETSAPESAPPADAGAEPSAPESTPPDGEGKKPPVVEAAQSATVNDEAPAAKSVPPVSLPDPKEIFAEKARRLGLLAVESPRGSEKDLLEDDLRTAMKEGSSDCIEAVFECIIASLPGFEALTRLVLRHGCNARFEVRNYYSVRMAREGSIGALYYLAVLSSGFVSDPIAVDRSSKAFISICSQQPTRHIEAASILASVYTQFSDKGMLLQTLAQVAELSADCVAINQAFSCARQAYDNWRTSGDDRLRERAMNSFSALAAHWTPADVNLLMNQLPEALLRIFVARSNDFSSEIVALIIERIEETLISPTAIDEQKIVYIKALTAICERTAMLNQSCLDCADKSKVLAPHVHRYLVAMLMSADAREALNLLINQRASLDQMGRQTLAEHVTVYETREELLALTRRCLEKRLDDHLNILLERCLVVATEQERPKAQIEFVEECLEMSVHAGNKAKSAECRKLLMELLEQIQKRQNELHGQRLLKLARSAAEQFCWAEADQIAQVALGRFDSGGTVEERKDCLALLLSIAEGLGNQASLVEWRRRINLLESNKGVEDTVAGVLKVYAKLPEQIDLSLRSDGITLKTNNFPDVLQQTTSLNLRQYFLDVFRAIPNLTNVQKDRLASDFFGLFVNVREFSTTASGAALHRTSESVIALPTPLSLGLVQEIIVGREVKFRLLPNLPDEATFVNLSGVSLRIGQKVIALADLTIKASGDKCTVTPVLREEGMQLGIPSFSLDKITEKGKELIAGALIKMGKIALEFPCVYSEFCQYLADAANFKAALQVPSKDLISLLEHICKTSVDDPLVRTLFHGCIRFRKSGVDLTFDRASGTECEAGSIVLKALPSVKMSMMRDEVNLRMEKLEGISIKVPFDSPPALKDIGLDLRRSLPRNISSLHLGSISEHGYRSMVMGTGPSRWIACDLTVGLKPWFDQGYWRLYGVVGNPVTGALQKFYVTLDRGNQVCMSADEIADLALGARMDGFSLTDPSSWKLAAISAGEQGVVVANKTLSTAKEHGKVLGKKAKRIGQLLGIVDED